MYDAIFHCLHDGQICTLCRWIAEGRECMCVLVSISLALQRGKLQSVFVKTSWIKSTCGRIVEGNKGL